MSRKPGTRGARHRGVSGRALSSGWVAALSVTLLLAAACASTPDAEVVTTPEEPTPISSPAIAPAAPPPRPTTVTEPTPAPAEPFASAERTPLAALPYEVTISPIDAATRDRIEPTSWRPGCPVGLDDLRLLTVTYWNDDGGRSTGELIVAASWADDIADVFGDLYEARFPIHRMELVDTYGGDDLASMRANNTSGFNCREVANRPGVWSNHAYGEAIDINPLVNPYVSGSFVDPPEGAAYVDRDQQVVGMIQPGDAVVVAFTEIGWIWGGTWSGLKDYQHFSANGR